MTRYKPLEQQLCFSLYSTSLAINRLYKPLLDGLGITYPQYLVLNTLWEEDSRSIGSIAARLELEPSTITPLVKRLEAASLVSRKRSTKDERTVLVKLTERGKSLSEQSRCLGETLFAKASMTIPEMISLNKEVLRLHDALTTETN